MARWLTLLICFTFLFSSPAMSTSFAVAEESATEKTHESKDHDSEKKDAETKDQAEKKSEKTEKEEKLKEESDKQDSNAKEEGEKTAKTEDKEDEKDADEAEKKEDEGKKPETHKVETKDLKIEVTIDGVFVAEEAEEVVLRPETWSSFKVVEAVEHGAQVRKGDVLVEFDDRKFEEQLADKALDQRLGELAMMEAEEEFPRLEKAMELSFAQAKRDYEEQQFELERYKETMRPITEKSVRNNLKSAEQYYANAKEELEQLEKMYDADEITEETEEIVLKRQRHALEMAEFYLEYSQLQHDYTLEVAMPRRDESLESSMKFAELAYERAKMLKENGLTKKRYEMEKKREARARSVEAHAKLLSDKSLMKLKAPVDGIVYYGDCKNGRWGSVNSLKSKLVPFGSVSANSVVMTIVQPRPLFVISSVGEKDYPKIEKGMEAIISPVADSELEFDGKLEAIASAPAGSNKFEVELDVDLDDAPDWLLPGLTCKVKLTTYEADDAVVVPQEYVNTDEDDSDEKYVLVLEDKDEEPVRRKVKLGKKKDKEVEILKGLEEGDEIVKKEEEKKD